MSHCVRFVPRPPAEPGAPEGMSCCSVEEEEGGEEWAVKLPALGGVTPLAFHFLPFLPFLPLPFELAFPPVLEEAA